jgi:hypothetical protein
MALGKGATGAALGPLVRQWSRRKSYAANKIKRLAAQRSNAWHRGCRRPIGHAFPTTTGNVPARRKFAIRSTAMQSIPKLLMIVSVVMFLASHALAANPVIHEGVVVSAGAGKLTMKDKAGKEHSHLVGSEVKITVHGKPGKLEDLQLGVPIRVTVDGSNVLAVSTIDDMK